MMPAFAVSVLHFRTIASAGWLGSSQASLHDVGLRAMGATLALLCLCTAGFALIAILLRYRNGRTEREWRAREEKWQQPLLDVLAGPTPPAALWALVDEDEGLYFVDYLVRYARRLRGSARHVLEELARPYLPAVVERMRGGDPERRARAVETVAVLGFGPHQDAVLAAMADSSPHVALVAARSVARHGRVEHVERVLAEASRLSAWSPRQLVSVLVSMGPAAAPVLRVALADRGRAPEVRAVAADALRKLNDPEASRVAADLLGSETDREVLAAALRLLADQGSACHAGVVRPYASHPDPVLRGVAVRVLSRTGSEEDLEILRLRMHDESGWVAIQAVRAVRAAGDGDSLRALAQGDAPRALLARQVLLEPA